MHVVGFIVRKSVQISTLLHRGKIANEQLVKFHQMIMNAMLQLSPSPTYILTLVMRLFSLCGSHT
jgi:hypothetical protein